MPQYALLSTQPSIVNVKYKNLYRKRVKISFLVGVGFFFGQSAPNGHKMSSLDPRNTFYPCHFVHFDFGHLSQGAKGKK